MNSKKKFVIDLENKNIDWSLSTLKPFEIEMLDEAKREIKILSKMKNKLIKFHGFLGKSKNELIAISEKQEEPVELNLQQKLELIEEKGRCEQECSVQKQYLESNGFLKENRETALTEVFNNPKNKIEKLSITMILILSIADGFNLYFVGKNLGNFEFLNFLIGSTYAISLLYFSYLTKREGYKNYKAWTSFSVYCFLISLGIIANFTNKTGLNLNFDIYNLLKIIVLSLIPLSVVTHDIINKPKEEKVDELFTYAEANEVDPLLLKKLNTYESNLRKVSEISSKINDIDANNQSLKESFEKNSNDILTTLMNINDEEEKVLKIISNLNENELKVQNSLIENINDYRDFVRNEFEFYGITPVFVDKSEIIKQINTNLN